MLQYLNILNYFLQTAPAQHFISIIHTTSIHDCGVHLLKVCPDSKAIEDPRQSRD